MGDPIRLWREPPSSCEPERWRSYRVDDFQEEYRALPVAEWDALQARLASAERQRDEARALLGRARGYVEAGGGEVLVEDIDAALRGGEVAGA